MVPGSAHLVAGRRGLGRFLVRIWLIVVALALLTGLVFLVDKGFLLGLSLQAVAAHDPALVPASASVWAGRSP